MQAGKHPMYGLSTAGEKKEASNNPYFTTQTWKQAQNFPTILSVSWLEISPVDPSAFFLSSLDPAGDRREEFWETKQIRNEDMLSRYKTWLSKKCFYPFCKLRCSCGCCGMGGQEGPESWGHRRAELQAATTPCPHGKAGLLLPLPASLGQGSLPPMAGMWETSAWFMDKSVSISKRSDDFQVSCLGRETKWLSVIF